MLTLCRSNRVERLGERLAEALREPAGPPLAPETVVVPGAGVRRWLAGCLAARLGVCANVRFPLPAAFIWECFRTVLPEAPDSSPFAPEPLAWRVLAALDALAGESGFEAVRRYLAGGDALRRYRLAGCVAEVLDQYQVYRPDWVRAWEAGEGGDWQALLWRRLAAGGDGWHWVRAHDAFLAALARGPAPTGLPARVSLFALPALSPTYLDLLAQLAERIDVYLYVLAPSREYWGDVEAPATIARLRGRWRRAGRPDASAYYAVGNPLLASLGGMGRDLHARLAGYSAWEEEAYEVPEGAGLLAGVQRDLLDLREAGEGGPRPADPEDRSIQVHSCHSPLREVQVLHDRLLDLFERLPGLEPREVLVTAPAMDAYAPLVEAVFGAGEGERRVPFSIARGDPAAAHPVVAACLELLALPASRLAASEVLGLLEVPAVARRLGLAPEDLDRVRTWVREAGVRWGADGPAREALGLPGFEANSWAFGLRRLFLGYAMPPGEALFRGVLPYPDLEGTGAAALGALQGLVDLLVAWQARLARGRDPAAWVATLGELIDAFFTPDPGEADRLDEVREAAAAFLEETGLAGFTGEVPREVFAERLTGLLAAGGGGRGLGRGGVTFASLAALRGVPARVVCLLGLNAADLPRSERPPGFDRIAREPPRPGDRSRREDDRHRFLEAILAARDVLYLSYVGRSARDNSRAPPSVLVSELLDYLARAHGWEDREAERRLVTEHPLQPFSRRYFDGRDPGLFSFAAEWLPGRADGGAGVPFADRPLPPPEAGPLLVDLDRLAAFFANPSRHFLAERLGLRLEEAEAPLADAEAFGLERLDAYRLRAETLARAVAGEPVAGYLPVLQARGDLPPGAAGAVCFRREVQAVPALAATLAPLLAQARPPLEVDLELAGGTLRGWLAPVTDAGLLAYRAASLTPKDRLTLWIRHLALNALAPAGVTPASTHVGTGRTVRLAPVADARDRLAGLLTLYREGQGAPLPFYPAVSLAYAEALAKGEGPDAALLAAGRAWDGSPYQRGAREDPYVALAERGRDPLGGRFAALAVEVFAAMLAAEEAGRGGGLE